MGLTAVPELTPTQRAMDARDWTFRGTWPYEPRWLFADGIRLHYVDEGPRDAAPLVLMHGTPYWSYVFRDEIAGRVAAGLRAIAYDQLGFGRSDKPERESEYSLERDVGHLGALVEQLGLERPSLVAQTSAIPIARAYGAADVVEREEPPLPGLARAPVLGRVLLKGLRLPIRKAPLGELERAAYLAPHPSWASRSGIVASLRRAA
ncbi:MAG: alpha/beta fold hydrolase [Thermoleophilia bacterium]|nr:alpha/beta fold hydrolase [Thermoleophilia bacterium]